MEAFYTIIFFVIVLSAFFTIINFFSVVYNFISEIFKRKSRKDFSTDLWISTTDEFNKFSVTACKISIYNLYKLYNHSIKNDFECEVLYTGKSMAGISIVTRQNNKIYGFLGDYFVMSEDSIFLISKEMFESNFQKQNLK